MRTSIIFASNMGSSWNLVPNPKLTADGHNQWRQADQDQAHRAAK